jgi:UDP-glucose 4-epimerase
VVTGVSRFLGARVASRLAADPRIERVVGLDPDERVLRWRPCSKTSR